MRKNYTVSLDKENVERLQVYLSKGGMTFSGYLSGCVNEFVAALDKRLPDKVEDMTFGDVMTMTSHLIDDMKGKDKK